MAVAHSTITASNHIVSNVDGPSTKTIAITETGTNTLVLVQVTVTPMVGNNVSNDGYEAVTGITCDGNALTWLMQTSVGGLTCDWYYRAGAIGTSKNVVITYDNSVSAGLYITSSILIETVTGALQSSSILQSSSGSGSATPISIAMTPASADNLLADGAVVFNGSTSITMTENGDGTQRAKQSIGSLGARHNHGLSTYTGGTGSKTMSFSISTSKPWHTGVVEIGAAPTATPATAERNATVTGKDTADADRPAIAAGKAATSADREATTHGSKSAVSDCPATIAGKDAATGEREAATAGQALIASNRDARVHGAITDASERYGAVSGRSVASGERSGELKGQDSAYFDRYALAHGMATTSAERSARTFGIIRTGKFRTVLPSRGGAAIIRSK